jgi:hypothetical protein
VPPGNTSGPLPLVLLAQAGANISWSWTGTDPDHWETYQVQSDFPSTNIDTYAATDRTGTTSQDAGHTLYIIGVASDGVTAQTAFSNQIIVLS